MRLIDGPLAGMMWPVLQTSANHSGEPAPSTFADVPHGVLSAVDVAIDGGALTGSPSTVVDVTALDTTGEWTILRQGGMPAEELRERLGAL